MKKSNVLMGLVQLMGAIILGWILWLFIFASIIPEEQEISNCQSGMSSLLGAVTGVLVLMIIKYNGAHRAQQTARKALSDIKVYEEKSDRLLDKANRVADKYMKHEKKIYTGIEEARNQGKGMVIKIRNGSEFQQAVEKFPELRSNENIQLLLRQIRECENGLAGQKLTYNTCVGNYNVAIHSFPFSIIRNVCGFENMEFYKDSGDGELISDEALGI